MSWHSHPPVLALVIAHAFLIFLTNVQSFGVSSQSQSPSTTKFPFYNNQHQRRRHLFASKTENNNNALTQILHDHHLDERLHVLSAHDLPVLAEVYRNKKMELCAITALQLNPKGQPTLQVHPVSQQKSQSQSDDHLPTTSPSSMVVDMGQITTLWTNQPSPQDYPSFSTNIDTPATEFPVGFQEAALDEVYKSRHAIRPSTSSITKKQIAKLVSRMDDDKDERNHAELVLRQLVKTNHRMIDSWELARDVLYDNNNQNNNDPTIIITPEQQAVAAQMLAMDAETGGRFKRQSCLVVDTTTTTTMITKQNDQQSQSQPSSSLVESITLINGGWWVVDSAMRAGSEARKFANRAQQQQQQQQQQQDWTCADERITQRLECLAMGEALHQNAPIQPEDSSVELDVREALQSMNMPLTPQGAKQVLIQMGRWSPKADTTTTMGDQAWSPAILQAARDYADQCQTKQSILPKKLADLSKMPFVCIDAKGTSFRDDAIGVRPRATTGRKMTDGNKWEILVAITDVSDIYLDDDSSSSSSSSELDNNVIPLDVRKRLREGAANRGVSRYDLPLGPLHLMPPVALEALAFDTVHHNQQNNNINNNNNNNPPDARKQNRAVVVWAYIDQKTGKMLDAGVEQAIIPNPVALSYAMASDLLDGKLDKSKDPSLHRTWQVLGVADRSISAWSRLRRETSQVAQKREERLALKEFVAKQQTRSWSDNGRDGFQRTRGHRLVDSSLDLYSYVVKGLVRRSGAYLPQQAGSGQARGGRVATAPLRRYVDGMAQRQILAALCGYKDSLMSKAECRRVGEKATDSYNTISNIRAIKKGSSPLTSNNKALSKQKAAVRDLSIHLSGNRDRRVRAVTTGRGNEVVIPVVGGGALAKCKGVNTNFKPGEHLQVQVHKIDVDSGNLSVTLAEG
ncbi:expressed unknown protein [Seminavis robusta]|uniref:RNB domain-containing protein n=1 Tax=Seminavis robusta TaxID=568900 RepID=A0A9N8DH65_9STRA|nr:expressed unknown protein [Seminavis robusta]|eukprot:Sro86_g045860.1 n/a (913) ;mRNA; f:105040-107778